MTGWKVLTIIGAAGTVGSLVCLGLLMRAGHRAAAPVPFQQSCHVRVVPGGGRIYDWADDVDPQDWDRWETER